MAILNNRRIVLISSLFLVGAYLTLGSGSVHNRVLGNSISVEPKLLIAKAKKTSKTSANKHNSSKNKKPNKPTPKKKENSKPQNGAAAEDKGLDVNDNPFGINKNAPAGDGSNTSTDGPPVGPDDIFAH